MIQNRPGLARPRRATSTAPKHLETPERELWAKLLETFRLDDAGSLALLTTTLEAHQRARRCRLAIDRDGETTQDRFGQLKPHPLLPTERDSRAAWLSGMRALRLDVGDQV